MEPERAADGETSDLLDGPSLPVDRTFVVQFRRAAAAAGRVEHLTTGATARFSTWPELREFLERTLTDGDHG